MNAAVRAGALYFACVFAAGFVLGTIRVLAVAPAIGATAAVSLECPVLLGWSWFVCGRILARRDAPGRWSGRFAMGAVAFALTMAAELGLSLTAGGGSVRLFWSQYRDLAGAIGLSAQIIFGLLPLVR